MTRIVGTLYGPDGPLNGRLFVKPSTPFIGFTKGVSFKIIDGQVDIELPPNTSTTVFKLDGEISLIQALLSTASAGMCLVALKYPWMLCEG